MYKGGFQMEVVHFRKAPIVEISVQVQWLPINNVVVPPHSAAVISVGGEEFFSEFAAMAAAAGFTQSERLVPLGVPTIPYQPVFRYQTGSPGKVILQLGQGVLTVSAVPPYKTWEHFLPSVSQVLSMLFAVLPQQQKSLPFQSVQVRYLNIFADEILQGLSPTRFVTETLNWQMKVPEALRQNVDMSTADAFFFRSGFTASDSVHLFISLGEALRNSTPVALLDLLTERKNVEKSEEAVITATENMHMIIHKTFVKLVKPIQDLLDPVQEGDDNV